MPLALARTADAGERGHSIRGVGEFMATKAGPMGFHLGVPGRWPLNNSPFYRNAARIDRSLSRAARAFAYLLFAALLVTGCGKNDEPKVSVQEAASREGQVLRVEGFAFSRGGVLRLCERLSRSVPPTCLGASIPVNGMAVTEIDDIQQSGGVAWSEQKLTALGKVERGTLVRLSRQ